METANTLHIYTRVSTTVQEEEGTSLETQLQEGIKRAEKLGMKYHHWNEGGASSAKDSLINRPVLQDLLQKVDTGEIKDLYVWNTDRLSRNLNTWGMIRYKLVSNDVILHTPTGKQMLSDPQTNMVLGILSEISQYDNQLRTERFRLGRFNRIKKGGWLGGPTPYGYKNVDSKLEIDEYEKEWVEDIINMYIDKRSIDDIRSHLLKNGVVTRRNNPIWSHGSIRSLITNTHYSGSYKVTDSKSQETYTVYCDPIISPQTSIQLKNEIKRREYKRGNTSQRKHSQAKHDYVLKGLLECGSCGSIFRVRKYAKGYKNHYYCPCKEDNFRNTHTDRFKECNLKRPSLKIPLADKLIWDSVIEVISKSALFKEQIKKEILNEKSYGKTEKELESLRIKLKRINVELNLITEALISLETNEILKTGTKKEQIDSIKDRESSLIKIRDEILENIGIKTQDRKWVNWIEQFGDRIKSLKDEKLTEKEKFTFLNGIVKRIVVNAVDNTTHNLNIQFQMKFVNDNYQRIVNKNSKYKYEIVDGDDELVVSLKKEENVSNQ